VAISADRNVVQKEAEKKLKYMSLCIQIQRLWNLKCKIVPVIIGATEIVTNGWMKSLVAIPGKHSIDSPKRAAILGTSHTVRKVLQSEPWSLSGGDHRWLERSIREKRPVTRVNNNNIIIIIINVVHLTATTVSYLSLSLTHSRSSRDSFKPH
jgi:hypothetical protein